MVANAETVTCGHCGVLAYQQPIGNARVETKRDDLHIVGTAHMCVACERITAREHVFGRMSGPYSIPDHVDVTRWYPDKVVWEEFPDVPPHIAAAASEAVACLSFKAYRAVGALARAVVEAACKEQKAEGGNLYKRIESLAEAGVIRPGTAESAHEIRHIGNGSAHGDFAESLTQEEAEEAIEFMREVLAEVYVYPARRKRAKERREESKIKQ